MRVHSLFDSFKRITAHFARFSSASPKEVFLDGLRNTVILCCKPAVSL
jgi:hypothetical protein